MRIMDNQGLGTREQKSDFRKFNQIKTGNSGIATVSCFLVPSP